VPCPWRVPLTLHHSTALLLSNVRCAGKDISSKVAGVPESACCSCWSDASGHAGTHNGLYVLKLKKMIRWCIIQSGCGCGWVQIVD
jgi:hypothetical protein